MNNRNKFELTWIGKERQPKLEPRILIEDPEKSYGDPHSENMLIYGDNLLALKALEQDFDGKIKCICIDPPYNTGSAFDHYDDGVEHSLWLSLMRDRLEILRQLLSEDGSLWILIDDNEGHYLKVLCDEIFGRRTFISTVVWENFYGRSNAAAISPSHNYILVYSLMGIDWKRIRNLLPRDEKSAKKYTNPDNDPRGPWRLGPIFAAEERHEGLMYSIKTPSGRVVRPPKGSHWRMTENDFWNRVEEGRITFGPNGDNIPAIKLYLSEVQAGLVPRTWWPHDKVGHTQEAKREIQALFPNILPFDTPKPERLVQRIIQIATNPGDWVLDSFLGSGTTAAVAHKMGRRWIGIELGEHCHTHCLPRLQKVVDGTDQGGISKAVNWKGGGGFKYYYLAPSLLKKDRYGNWVIEETYNADMLAAAMAKHEGFRYNPDEEVYWKQGQSTEKDFIYTTTQFVNVELLDRIHEEMKPDESLLITCKAFQEACERRHANITVKKIPNMLLGRCEFGKEDYSLNIVNMPVDPDAPEFVPQGPEIRKKGKPDEKNQLDLFSADHEVMDTQKDREDL